MERLTVSALLTVPVYVGAAFLGIWTLIDGIATFVLGLAGFQQDDDEGTRLPNRVGWSAMTFVLLAIGVLVYAFASLKNRPPVMHCGLQSPKGTT